MLSFSLLWLCVYVPLAQAYLISVDVNDEECFHEHLSTRNKMAIVYDVLDGGFRDIQFRLLSPNQSVIYDDSLGDTQRVSSSGRYVFAAQTDGEHRFCFINKQTSMAVKTIKFTSEAEHPSPQMNEHDQVDLLSEHYIQELASQLAMAKYESEYAIFAMADHHALSEKTNSYVIFWTCLEYLIAVTMVLVLVIFLRRLLAVRTPV